MLRKKKKEESNIKKNMITKYIYVPFFNSDSINCTYPNIVKKSHTPFVEKLFATQENLLHDVYTHTYCLTLK